MTAEEVREWGPWSVWKTEVLLAKYVPLFALASSSTEHRTFIDCFAGAAQNVERETGRRIKSSPRVALDVASPQFTHVVCIERPEKADQLRSALQGDYPSRNVHVVGGDCNADLGFAFEWLASTDGRRNRGPFLGPILAYVDPNKHQDLAWQTVESIAKAFQDSYPPHTSVRASHKLVEQLILFPVLSIKRALPQQGKLPTQSDRDALTRFFGCDDWEDIYENGQRTGRVTGNDSWLLYLDLYRCRLQDLGYRHTSAIEVTNTMNGVVYYMVFATANTVGTKIMTSVAEKVREDLPRLIAEERALRHQRGRQGDPALFELSDEELVEIESDPRKFARLIRNVPRRFDPADIPDRPQLTLDFS